MRQRIGSHRENRATDRRDDNIFAMCRPRCQQDRDDVENGNGALERSEDVDQKNCEGEERGQHPQAMTAHGQNRRRL